MNKKGKKHSRQDWLLTLFALPFIIWTILFKYVPLAGWALAFTNYKPGRSLDKLTFVGFKYFKLIGYYWEEISNALKNTLVLSICSLIIMVLPMLFAVCLNEIGNLKLKKFIQTTVTLPHFVSYVIVFSISFALFSSNGLLNTLLIKAGVLEKPFLILSNLEWAWPFMVLLDIWKQTGWNSIIYMAAIAGIDQAQYEAAKLDGAGRFACARYITLPNLIPTYLVLLVLQIGNILNTGIEKYLLYSNTVTSPRLEVLDMFVYRVGLLTQDYSFAIAVGILKSLVSILLVVIANVIAKKMRGSTII